MTSEPLGYLDLVASPDSCLAGVKERIGREIDDLIVSLPPPHCLPPSERRGIIARYTAVLEGNFIYWMTSTYLSVRSRQAHSFIEDNLREEVRDNHPGMLRRFAVAARGTSTDSDRNAIDRELQEVRAFVARLNGLPIILMMAFLEGFIARFMTYLAALAVLQGSDELEYTDVHGVVDIAHTQGLFEAFGAELALMPSPPPAATLLEGVGVLKSLLETIVRYRQ